MCVRERRGEEELEGEGQIETGSPNVAQGDWKSSFSSFSLLVYDDGIHYRSYLYMKFVYK